MMTRETNAFIAPIVLLDEDGVGGNQAGSAGSEDPAIHDRPGLNARPY